MTNLVAAVLVLLGGAGACLLPIRNHVRAVIGIASQIAATLLVWAVVIPVLIDGGQVVGELAWAYPVGTIRVRLDALGAFFLAWSLPMTLVGAVYARGYLASYFRGPRNVGVHYALLNMTSLSFILVYTGEHALIFLLGWEIAALAAWLLVIWDYHNQKVRFAGFNYLVSTHLGLLFLVAAFMILYTHTGSWALTSFGAWLSAGARVERNVVFLLLVASFGLKSAFFPFHSWLPRAHSAAPAHVSALMSGVIHKAGLYALIRFLILLGRPDEWMGWFLIAFSTCSAVVGALYTVMQRDLKRLLGYSSTENVGIAGIGIGVGCLGLTWNIPALAVLGFAAGLLHVLNHAFFKCLLFYAAGAVYRSTHSVDLERLGGLARLMPWTGTSFLIGGLAISALPPFNGFASEFLLYSALFTNTPSPLAARAVLVGVAALLAFVGAVSALSMTRAFGVAFLGQRRDTTLHTEGEVGGAMLLPLALHAAGVVVLGVAPVAGLTLVRRAASLALSSLPVETQSLLVQEKDTLAQLGAVSGCLAAAIVLALWLRKLATRKPPEEHVTWACGYTAVGPRLQYTGASFSSAFAELFKRIVTVVRRQTLPRGFFPQEGSLSTHCVDAVERRLFEVIGRGDQSAARLSSRLGEDQPRVAFALGLAAIMLIAAIVLLSEGGCI